MRIKSGNTGDKSGLALCSKEVGNPIESVGSIKKILESIMCLGKIGT